MTVDPVTPPTPESAAGRREAKRAFRLRTPDEIAQLVDQIGPVAKPEPSFDDRCARWVQRANKLMMDGARLATEAETVAVIGGHAAMALLIYERITERHLDAELRVLLEGGDAS